MGREALIRPDQGQEQLCIGVPAGFGLNRLLVSLINDIGNNDTPAAMYEVFGFWELLAIPRWPLWPSPWRRRCSPAARPGAPA